MLMVSLCITQILCHVILYVTGLHLNIPHVIPNIKETPRYHHYNEIRREGNRRLVQLRL